MKVWWVLCWEDYYPDGGLGNVWDSYATKEEAEAAAAEIEKDACWDNVEVVNIEDML